MIIDVILYNGESDLLEIRLNILNDFVDEFIICESSQTFTGKDKPYYFEQEKKRFAEWLPKIKYYHIDNFDNKALWDMAFNSQNTEGALHWKQEFYIKESIKNALTHLNDDDIVFIGDCDEIWSPDVSFLDLPIKIKLRVYTYFLNNRSSEEFWGTLQIKYGDLKNACLNHLRSDINLRGILEEGWHFTSMHHQIEKKLTDSYTSDSYASPQVMEHLAENVKNNKDFLGRPFTYKIDESELPKWLIENKDKYSHLWKQSA